MTDTRAFCRAAAHGDAVPAGVSARRPGAADHVGRARSGRAAIGATCLTAFLMASVVAGVPAAAQHDGERVDAARNLYASARYEDALAVLDPLRDDAQADRKVVEKYRSLCLLALGRSEEAARAIAAVVTADPLYEPEDTEASPRVRATFAEVRRQLLPGIATERYVAAKAAYDRREWDQAAQQFQLVLSLIDDPAAGGRLADLRLLAAGFLELSAQALEASLRPPEPEPELPDVNTAVDVREPDAARPAVEAEPDRIFSLADVDVVPPVVIRQELPPVPGALTSFSRPRGLLEVVIDELGRVVSMSVRESIHPTYDVQLLTAATDWKYEPATRAGRPVRFRRLIQINLAR